jgi:hypothetical protein
MTIRIGCNTNRDLDCTLRAIEVLGITEIEFSRRARRIVVDNASAEDFDDIVAEIQARGIECRAIVD